MDGCPRDFEQSWENVDSADQDIRRTAGRDHAGPANNQRNVDSTFEQRSLARRKSGTVVAGHDDERRGGKARVVERIESHSDHVIGERIGVVHPGVCEPKTGRVERGGGYGDRVWIVRLAPRGDAVVAGVGRVGRPDAHHEKEGTVLRFAQERRDRAPECVRRIAKGTKEQLFDIELELIVGSANVFLSQESSEIAGFPHHLGCGDDLRV